MELLLSQPNTRLQSIEERLSSPKQLDLLISGVWSIMYPVWEHGRWRVYFRRPSATLPTQRLFEQIPPLFALLLVLFLHQRIVLRNFRKYAQVHP